jgi:outer membrane lipoprotein-sorting protein
MKLSKVIGFTLPGVLAFVVAFADGEKGTDGTAKPTDKPTDKPRAEELLQASDRARGAAASTKGLIWGADIETNEGGGKNQVTYEIRARGNDAIAKVLAPARQKGEVMLFNDRTLWFVKPGLKKPVSISPRQRLMGQAANGDIASTQYVRDYEGTIQGEEVVNGIATWRLDLQARAKNVTYDKIRYWINKEKRLGVKAEFLTVGGEVFKIAEFKYQNSISIAEKKFPFVSEMVIRDANDKNNVTRIQYKEPKETENQPSLFNVNNLLR